MSVIMYLKKGMLVILFKKRKISICIVYIQLEAEISHAQESNYKPYINDVIIICDLCSLFWTASCQESVHPVLPSRAAALQTGPLRLWAACVGVRAEICRLQEEV